MKLEVEAVASADQSPFCTTSHTFDIEPVQTMKFLFCRVPPDIIIVNHAIPHIVVEWRFSAVGVFRERWLPDQV